MGHHGWQGNPPGTEDEARRRIVEATTACLDRAGLAKTSLSDVAAEAGVTRQTVYRYFPSLKDILRAVALAGVEEFAGRMERHLATFGTAEDGRLFFSEKGSVVPSSTYYRVWQEARLLALPPAAASSPLASRLYDLRHSALSTWLNAGVDPTEVAERAGNSVEVLLTRYAKCIDGRQDVANRRIEDLLREYE